jgi:serine phosphatase RsbU (regulator of sigma subunit)
MTEDKKNYIIDYMHAPEEFELRAKHMAGKYLPVNDAGGTIALCILSRQKIYYPNIDSKDITNEINRKSVELFGLKGVLHLPIIINDEVIGTLMLSTYTKPLTLSPEDIQTIERFVDQIASAINNTKQKVQLESFKNITQQELSLANQIQANIIPQVSPSLPGVAFAYKYIAMEDIGGDLFDFIDFRNNRELGIFISDVSGHGIPAALITMMIKSIIDTSGDHKFSPKQFLQYLNMKIYKKTNNNFLTAFYGVYNSETKILKYSRGSHEFPLLIRNNTISSLESRGKMLGIEPVIDIQEKEIQLQSGDKVLFFTDGLTESTNDEQVEFQELLNEILLQNAKLPIKEFIEKLWQSLRKHHGNGQFEDDVCIVGMEIL